FALLLELLFAVDLHWLPAAGNEGARSLVLPSICLAVYSLAFIARMTRAALLETYGQDSVRTAQAKGLAGWRVVGRHDLPTAFPAILTAIGMRLGFMIARAVVIE